MREDRGLCSNLQDDGEAPLLMFELHAVRGDVPLQINNTCDSPKA